MRKMIFVLLFIIATTILYSNDNIADTVRIGNQLWMSRNLDVTHYRNGKIIFHAETKEQWDRAARRGIGAWCYYENDTENGKVYGVLYNWHAVTNRRGLAPKGWRIPKIKDWEELIEYLGGEIQAGGKLKSADTLYWKYPNVGATNESGFTALGAGFRSHSGEFWNKGIVGMWWTSESTYKSDERGFKDNTADIFVIHYDKPEIFFSFGIKSMGISIRLIKIE